MGFCTKNILFIAIGLLFFNKITAQSFTVVGDSTVVQQVEMNLVNEVYIYFDRTTSDSVYLSWKRLSSDIPDGWFVDLCDLGACYSGIPSGGEMNAMTGSELGYLKLVVRPEGNQGEATCRFRVWETGESEDYIDVQFRVHTDGFVDVELLENELSVTVFPNPISSVLFLKNESQTKQSVLIFDALGNRKTAFDLNGQEQKNLTVDDWAAGLYFLKMQNGETQTILKN